MTHKSHGMWGGRFSESPSAFVQRFTASVTFDKRLYAQDIAGSVAHATMLFECGILTRQEKKLLIDGLQKIKQEIESDTFNWRIELEDVHMNIEHRLTELVGDVGKKLHTARSRNDQVALDMRLFVRDATHTIITQITKVQKALVAQAEQHKTIIMPGMTHLQFAQPVLFSHHLLAWCFMLARDAKRFAFCQQMLDCCPLGAAALAGSSFAVNPQHTSNLLGFSQPVMNSLDSVSDRDFIVDFIYAAAQLLTHISRWAEEMILWSSVPFGWIDLPDALCTGSSIMPQKKNPDVPELLRGKTARVYGNLTAILTLMKAQPLAYNKDNQEDKEMLFDAVDTATDCLTATEALVRSLRPHAEKMHSDAALGYTTATDLADYLVRGGIAFRDAHAITGQLVKQAESNNIGLDDLPLAMMQEICPLIQDDVYKILTPIGSVAAREHIGGTSVESVERQIAYFKAELGIDS